MKRRMVVLAIAVLVLSVLPAGAGNGPVVERVTGGWHFTLDPSFFGFPVEHRFSLNARKYENGVVRGVWEFQQLFLEFHLTFNVSVTCFNLYDGGTRAKVGGVVEISNDPDVPPGTFLWFQAIDNGEGGMVPDITTGIAAGDEAANEAFCNSPAPPNFQFDATGNIQIEG